MNTGWTIQLFYPYRLKMLQMQSSSAMFYIFSLHILLSVPIFKTFVRYRIWRLMWYAGNVFAAQYPTDVFQGQVQQMKCTHTNVGLHVLYAIDIQICFQDSCAIQDLVSGWVCSNILQMGFLADQVYKLFYVMQDFLLKICLLTSSRVHLWCACSPRFHKCNGGTGTTV